MYSLKTWKTSLNVVCTFGVFLARAFVADFPPAAPRFHQRTHRVRLKKLGTTDKKIFSQNQEQKDSKSTLVYKCRVINLRCIYNIF